MKMKKSARCPTSPFALRFAAIMHRATTTAWNEKREISNFRALSKHICESDVFLVERYYRSNWPPRTGHNHLRHDLATLINNWSGEVDRARIWGEAHPLKQPPRKIIPLPPTPSEPLILSAEEKSEVEKFMSQYHERKKHTSEFQKVKEIMGK